MIRITAISLAAATALASPALAGSLEPAPMEPAITPVQAAPVTYGNDWTGGYTGLSLGWANGEAGSFDDDGVAYGIQGGYDYDFGNWILGGELAYSGTNLSIGGVDVDSLLAAKARVGYDLGRTMIYATGGAEQAWVDGADDTGYVVGAGVEHMLTDTISVGGEYLYHSFDDFDGSGVDASGNTLAARVNYRF
ncbi:outer membrane protein [Pseudooceanicola sp. 502str34]